MKIKTDNRHAFIPTAILVFILLFIGVTYFGPNGDFAAITEMILADFIATMAGFTVTTLRLFKVPIKKTSFLYNFIGTVNAILGALSLVIVINGGFDFWPAVFGLLDIVFATFIYCDIFKKVNQASKN